MPYPIHEAGTTFDYWFFRLKDPQWCIQIVIGLLAGLDDERLFEAFGTATPADAVDYFRDALMTLSPLPLKPGMLMMHVGDVPPGWLACDGTIYDRVDYPQLYAALDAAFILDADQFAVPDLRDKFVLGAGSQAVGDEGGQAEVVLDVSQIPSHSHTYTPPTLNVDLESPGAPDVFAAGVGLPTQTSSVGGDQAHDNMPPYVVARYIIWTGL